jgi:exodeoxyribonuclease VII large subunit
MMRLSPQARVDTYRQQVDELSRRAGQALAHGQALRRSGLAGLEARLAALSPQATLERGYAIVRQAGTSIVVRNVDQVQAGDDLAVRVQDGEFEAVVTGSDDE